MRSSSLCLLELGIPLLCGTSAVAKPCHTCRSCDTLQNCAFDVLGVLQNIITVSVPINSWSVKV